MSSKQVSFGDLTVRRYPYELGDNPYCGSGAPLTIGWKAMDSTVRNLELHEYTQSGNRRHGKKQLTLSVQRRAQILLQAGYTIEEIANATMEVDRVKTQRADSLKNQGWDRTHMILETTGKLPKGILTGMANLLVVKPNASVNKKTILARSA
jgi:hypothetical protein